MKNYHLKLLAPLLCFTTNGFNIALRNKIILRQNNVCGHCKTPFSKLVPHEIHHLNHNKTDNNPLFAQIAIRLIIDLVSL